MDERDGLDRREDKQGVTLGEVHRLCLDIKSTLAKMQTEAAEESHNLRSHHIQPMATKLALLEQRVDQVQDKQKDSRNWLAGVVSGSVVGAVLLIAEYFLKK